MSPVDPTGKRALFGSPGAARANGSSQTASSNGRAALFSSGPKRPGTVIVECSGCTARSRVSLIQLAMLLLVGSVWLPLAHGRFSRWMLCPACNTRQWCRTGWNE